MVMNNAASPYVTPSHALMQEHAELEGAANTSLYIPPIVFNVAAATHDSCNEPIAVCSPATSPPFAEAVFNYASKGSNGNPRIPQQV